MTKIEYIKRLSIELEKKHIGDADDIISEYEQHFAFKTADGFSEDEICVKLGDPAALAAQFGESPAAGKQSGRKIITAAGLYLADIFAGMFFVLLFLWDLIMAVFSIACAGTAVCLLITVSPFGLIPSMPYWCGAVFALSIGALSVLSAAGCVYYSAFMLQLLRSYIRFHRNTLAAASQKPVLPSLGINPQLPVKLKRRLRSIALLALAVFAACFVLGLVVAMISAGAFEFWHVWDWFV